MLCYRRTIFLHTYTQQNCRSMLCCARRLRRARYSCKGVLGIGMFSRNRTEFWNTVTTSLIDVRRSLEVFTNFHPLSTRLENCTSHTRRSAFSFFASVPRAAWIIDDGNALVVYRPEKSVRTVWQTSDHGPEPEQAVRIVIISIHFFFLLLH